jgi:hypothetical protein
MQEPFKGGGEAAYLYHEQERIKETFHKVIRAVLMPDGQVLRPHGQGGDGGGFCGA